MYHVTGADAARSITTVGLEARHPGINPPGVYLFADLGDLIAHGIYGDMSAPIVFAVAVTGLLLRPDPDWVNAAHRYPNTAWYCPHDIVPERVAPLRRATLMRYDPWHPVNPNPWAATRRPRRAGAPSH